MHGAVHDPVRLQLPELCTSTLREVSASCRSSSRKRNVRWPSHQTMRGFHLPPIRSSAISMVQA